MEASICCFVAFCGRWVVVVVEEAEAVFAVEGPIGPA